MGDAPRTLYCSSCGTQVAAGLLACPACGWLVHGGRLRQLAGEAEAASAAGDLATALELWRTAMTLLPVGTRQHDAVVGKIE